MVISKKREEWMRSGKIFSRFFIPGVVNWVLRKKSFPTCIHYLVKECFRL